MPRQDRLDDLVGRPVAKLPSARGCSTAVSRLRSTTCSISRTHSQAPHGLTFSARAEGRTIPDVINQLKTRIGDGRRDQPTRQGDFAIDVPMAKAERSPLRLPRLVLEARRIAQRHHGLHAAPRRRPARASGNIAASSPRAVAERRLARSARDDHLYVREQDGEAAHTVWLWPDRSLSMALLPKGRATPSWSAADRYVRTRRIAGFGRRTRRHSRPDEPDASAT